ncbi:LptF/LptG family permease [Rapidithrix thailandica]|uniref:LptF/LptG family permease n=1 Tax=Rapidithrix thailandica TaxID=413964 RepID=A0AAW9S868_9BACT
MFRIKILDWYIFKKFITVTFYVILILNTVVCVIDYTEKSDDFLKHETLSYAEIFGDYYLNFFIFMANTLSPIAVFISVVFVTAKMASHSEIIAMRSAGVSLLRMMAPYMVGAICLGVASFFLVGWIIPNSSKIRLAFQIKYLKNDFYYSETDIHFKTDDSTYVYMRRYDNRRDVGSDFTVEKVIDGEMKYKLKARQIQWDTTQNLWHLGRYSVHTFDGEKESIWEGHKLDTMFNLYPKYFESRYKLNERLTFPELEEFIQDELTRGAGNVELYMHEKYERYAYPYAIVILTFMGVVVSARKSRQGTGAQIALGFFLAFLFLLAVMMSRSIGAAGALDPKISAWLPNATFFVIAIIMYYTFPR